MSTLLCRAVEIIYGHVLGASRRQQWLDHISSKSVLDPQTHGDRNNAIIQIWTDESHSRAGRKHLLRTPYQCPMIERSTPYLMRSTVMMKHQISTLSILQCTFRKIVSGLVGQIFWESHGRNPTGSFDEHIGSPCGNPTSDSQQIRHGPFMSPDVL